MTKVEINGRTYCVETLINAVERLTKDVKSSAEYHNLVLDEIRAEIAGLDTIMLNDNSKKVSTYIKLSDVREVIDKHSAESEEE